MSISQRKSIVVFAAIFTIIGLFAGINEGYAFPSGTIDDSSECLQGTPTAFVPYDSFVFTVPFTGSYTFSFDSKTIANSVWFYLYDEASFDPNQSWDQAGWLGTGNSLGQNVTASLTAGIKYLMATNNNQIFSSLADCQNRVSTVSGDYFLDSSSLITSYEPFFSDVPDTHWAFEYVQRIYQEGITTGYPDGTFRPGNQVTRAEMAAFIDRTIDIIRALEARIEALENP